MDHCQRVEDRIGNGNMPSKTRVVPVQTTESGAQTQHEANAVSETQTQAEVNKAPVHSVETQTQVAEANTVSVCLVETQTQAANLDKAISTVPATTLAETQIQAEANTVCVPRQSSLGEKLIMCFELCFAENQTPEEKDPNKAGTGIP
ncbi:hypothetical protein WISP_00917 [Willisornis vidua]|uniref:Uncharacterized protein n=1 Tax=Willisornis vidua TaxID=1566151 RepID=A0ABQ9E0K1_9PASS|nr:hypothetical protein WISP_00917 [Willisornis vidua]